LKEFYLYPPSYSKLKRKNLVGRVNIDRLPKGSIYGFPISLECPSPALKKKFHPRSYALLIIALSKISLGT